MKKTFSSLLDGADERDTEGFFEGVEEKTPPEGAIDRIEAKVVGRSEKKTPRGRIPLIVAAACFLLAASAVFIAAALNKSAPDTRYPKADAVETGSETSVDSVPGDFVETKNDAPDSVIPEDAVKLEATPDTVDRIDIKSDLGEGTFLQNNGYAAVDRELYSGVGLFESGGTPYLFYLERKSIYEVRETGLRDTGITVPEALIPFRSVTGDVAYLGGTFECVRIEKGLFKADLLAGKVEKIIDSPEIVSSVAVDEDRIWYLTHPSMSDYRYSLKCADLSTGEITVMILDSDDPIGSLEIIGDDLFFIRYNAGVFRISDGYLYCAADAPDVRSFCVSDGKIYVYETTTYDPTSTVRVSVFDGSGRVLGSKTVVNRAPYTEEGKNNLYFDGATCDGLTVYDGKVVSFDADGIYLENIESGTSEKIINLSDVCNGYLGFMFRQFWQGNDNEAWIAEHSEAVERARSHWYRGISKTVFKGKLYVMVGDELTEYDGANTRIIPFDSAS